MTELVRGALQPGDVVVYRAPHIPADQPGEAGVITSLATHDRGAFVRFDAFGSSKLCPADTLEKVAR